MARTLDIRFVSLDQASAPAPGKGGRGKSPTQAEAGVLVLLAGRDNGAMALSPRAAELLGDALAQVERAAHTTKFKGARGSAFEVLAPQGLAFDRLIVCGVAADREGEAAPTPPARPRRQNTRAELAASGGVALTASAQEPKIASESEPAAMALGGAIMGRLAAARRVSILVDTPAGMSAADAADLMLGLRLRAYAFDLYKTKKKDKEEADAALVIAIAVADPAAARREAVSREAIAAGVLAARDLVNEPANILYPDEFARRARALTKLGVAVEVLDARAMQKLGMNALLGVARGSRREGRLVVMRWNGAGAGRGARQAPVAFIGKGVTFDTGGISIKPAGGMEDMKGDMAGAACVVGLMRTLAMRKAKVNAVGVIGLVENMPDGDAQRPGDIVKSMSGQTIEVINTDAEGRLVLADALWYVQDRFKPQFMIDLATLTGAILVSLGAEYAGLFSNNDELAGRLAAVGQATGEKVWRMPLAPAYDKMIDSKFADMKNVGGRYAGSITAAQFLQRFVNKAPWAHLDIAGTGMASPASEINQSWGSGWGVRLLDRLVAEHYEG